MKKHLFVSFLGIFLFAVACKKDKPLPEPEKPANPGTSAKGGVFIVNEGNFQWGNASLGYFSFSDSSVSSDLFKSANNRPLGDVFQSMAIHKGRGFLVVNNSGKIEVINPKDGKSSATINGLSSPRYFLPFNSKAYVSNYSGNAITVVDLNTLKATKDIPCKGWTEEMIAANGKIFVSNLESEFIYIINPEKDLITDSIKTGYGSNSIVKDKNGKIWVLCGGDNSKGKPGSLHRINPISNAVETSFFYQNKDQNPFKLRVNSSGEVLYYLENGVQKMPVTASSLPASPFIKQEGTNYWALGIEPETGNIFVGDAIDYVQNGKAMVYGANGNYLYSFPTGIIPGGFYFD